MNAMSSLTRTGGARPVALIYDRAVDPAGGLLRVRLGECRAFALSRMWVPGGEWWDSGEVALTPRARPRLREALGTVAGLTRMHPEVVVLVHSRDRLSADSFEALGLAHDIEETGARVVVAFEDSAAHRCAAPLPDGDGAPR